MYKIIIFITIILFSCNPVIDVSEIILYPITKRIDFPVDFYVTEEFTDNQIQIVKSCLNHWTVKTNGMAKINIVSHWIPENIFSDYFYSTYPKKTIWLKDWRDDLIVPLVLKYSATATGYSVDNYIIIVKDSQFNDDVLCQAVLHEVGHQMGLQHIKIQYPALMNISANNGIITKYDLAEFCFIYNCEK
jgi:hypothetical protein